MYGVSGVTTIVLPSCRYRMFTCSGNAVQNRRQRLVDGIETHQPLQSGVDVDVFLGIPGQREKQLFHGHFVYDHAVRRRFGPRFGRRHIAARGDRRKNVLLVVLGRRRTRESDGLRMAGSPACMHSRPQSVAREMDRATAANARALRIPFGSVFSLTSAKTPRCLRVGLRILAYSPDFFDCADRPHAGALRPWGCGRSGWLFQADLATNSLHGANVRPIDFQLFRQRLERLYGVRSSVERTV